MHQKRGNSQLLPKIQTKKINKLQYAYLQRSGLGEQIIRCNTQPFSEYLHASQQNNIVRNSQQSYVSLERKEKEESKIKLIKKTIRTKKEDPIHQQTKKINKQSSHSKQIQQRKSIKQLIDFFDSKNQQLKNVHMNFLNNRNFGNMIAESKQHLHEYQTIKREVSHYSKVKTKLRKSQMKTEGNDSPKKKNKIKSSHLKNILKIQNVIVEQARDPHLFSVNKKLLFFKGAESAHSKDTKKFKNELITPKITSIGGWRTQKHESHYPI